MTYPRTLTSDDTDPVGDLRLTIRQVIAASAKLVEDYRSGNEKAFNALVGQVMKASKGQVNPALVNEVLMEYLRTSFVKITVGRFYIVPDDKRLLLTDTATNLELVFDFDDVNQEGVYEAAKLIARKLSEINAEDLSEALSTGTEREGD